MCILSVKEDRLCFFAVLEHKNTRNVITCAADVIAASATGFVPGAADFVQTRSLIMTKMISF